MKWAKVEGFENYLISENGDLKNTKTGKLLKPRYYRDGYMYYRLSKSRKEQKDIRIHRLVAMAFIPNVHNLETVNHIDGNKENNHVSNLEWSDRSKQLYHAYELGLKKPMAGTLHTSSKCSDEEVKAIRKYYDENNGKYGTVAYLSRKYNLSHDIVLRICKRKTYNNI